MNEIPMFVRRIDGIVVLGIGENAHGETVPDGCHLPDYCRGSRGIIFDLTACHYANSALLGRMIRVHLAALRTGTRLHVCCPPGEVRETMFLVQLEEVMPIFDTLAEALAAFE